MPKMSVIFTALPKGITSEPANRQLRLSVYVSLRLQTDLNPDGTIHPEGTLDQFPAALNWPMQVQPEQVEFFVQATNGQNGLKTKATIISVRPDPVRWADLFPGTTHVVSHEFDDLRNRPINTYAAHSVHEYLRGGHQRLSQSSPVGLPSRALLREAYSELHDAFSPAPLKVASPILEALSLSQLHTTLAENLFRSENGTGVHENVAQAIATAHQLAQTSPPGTFVPVVPNNGTPASHFAQLYAFHHRPPEDPKNPPPVPEKVDPGRILDFHQALATLGQYGTLLRQMGLVFDLEVPESALPVSLLGAPVGRVQVSPHFQATPTFSFYSPQTAYILDGNLFLPAPKTPDQPETIGGFLNLALLDQAGKSQYALVQIDIDSLGLKSLNMAAGQSLSGQDPTESDDVAGTAGTPATRTTGLSVTRSQHGKIINDHIARAADNNQGMINDQLANPTLPTVTLFAEDLTRGVRFDVRENTSAPWHSLHARTGTFTFKQHADTPLVDPVADEGLVQPAAGQLAPGNTLPPGVQKQLFVHESVMHWQGWSLAAPRPGKTLSNTGPDIRNSEVHPDGFQLEAAFKATLGTLPRLRFGRNYQVRGRVVDLAGNSLSLAEADAVLLLLSKIINRPAPILPTAPTQSSDKGEFIYRRFEPVVAPVLVPREKFSEGESLERLVIRSNGGEPAEACASRLMKLVADAHPNTPVVYTDVNERHVVPPKTSQWMVETLGMLDDPFGTPPNETPQEFKQRCERKYNIARKEKGRLTDNFVMDINTGQPVALPTGDVEIILTAEPAPSNAGAASDPHKNPPKGYAVHHEPQLRLPYLPDPLARGAMFTGLPGVPPDRPKSVLDAGQLKFIASALPPAAMKVLGSLTSIPFGTDWPERLPFRLQLAESPDPNTSSSPIWDPEARILTVHLAKAEQVTLRLSSFLAGLDDLNLLGLWQWILERNASQGLPLPNPSDAELAVAGGMWMITPHREIQLVHAVQQPLRPPTFVDKSVITPRDPGSTFAYFGATVSVHGQSTAKLDLLASWQERLDDPGPGVQANAHVFEVSIHLPSDPSGSGQAVDQSRVPVAIYDPDKDIVQFLATLPALPPPHHPPHHPPPPPPHHPPFPDGNGGDDGDDGDDESPAPPTRLSRHEFGDTKYRKVSYQAVATTRFREYFPQEVTRDPAQLTLAGPPAIVDVFSTARPAAPKVLHTLPMFEWTRETKDGSQMRMRKGGGVRVYLERPWFSSGDDERLGVVLAGENFPPDENLRPYVTQWGNDPIFQTGPVTRVPQVGNFSLTNTKPDTGVDLTLAELANGPKVQVIGFPVELNADRNLWYCDIHIDPGPSYYPFLRLALARFQPHSLPGVELSHVVLADFVQLVPDRTVIVSPVQGDPDSFKITVEGLTYQANAWRPGPEKLGRDEMILDPLPVAIPDLVQVSVERRILGTSDEAGWESPPVAQGIQMQVSEAVKAGQSTASGTLLWDGQVTLPKDHAPGQFRIVIKEFEHLPTDDRLVQKVHVVETFDPNEFPNHKAPPPLKTQPALTFFPGAPRLVFVETIENL